MSTVAKIQPEYGWLDKEPGPKHLLAALATFGTREKKGKGSNPVILQWASNVGGWVKDWYKDDDTPWCGLAMAEWFRVAGRAIPNNCLQALAWSTIGTKRVGPALLGDILTFTRSGGGHVGLYVGEDELTYHVLGGNQGDRVCVAQLGKGRLYAVRRPPYHVQPANVRRIFLTSTGEVSTNEQ